MARFGPPDSEKDEKQYRDYFVNTLLPDDAERTPDEEAWRENMFVKLAELARVVEEVKNETKKRKRKRG